MDQDPNMVGDAGANDPGQNTQFFNEPTPTSSNMPDLSPASESPFAPEPVAGAPEPMSTVAAIATEPIATPAETPEAQSAPEASAGLAFVENPTPETNQVVMGQPAAPADLVTRPVDSNYAEHDLRLPGDKKPKTALIIGAIAGSVALVLTCVAVWFFAIYSHPQKVVFDGVNNLLKAKNVAINGGASIALREKNPNATIQSAILNFNSSSSKLPNATDVSLYLQFTEGKSVNLQLGTVQMNDGVIYIKVSGIMDSLRRMGMNPDDPSLQESMADLFDLVELVDGEWWRISVRDVIREMTNDEEIVSIYGDFYDCILRASTRDNSKEILDLLKKHPFVDVAPVKRINSPNAYSDYDAAAWHKLYEVKFKNAELANFLNALPHTTAANEAYACYNTAFERYMPGTKKISADDIDEISASDISIPEKLHIFVEAAQFGHKIRSVWAYVDDENFNNSLAFTFDYKDAVVSAPNNYRDITELFKELPIENAWSSFTMSGLGGYGSSYGDFDYDYSYDESDDDFSSGYDLRVRTNETEAI